VLVVSRAVGPAGCDNPHFWRHLAKNRCQTRVVGRVGRPTTTLAKEESHRQDTASGALADALRGDRGMIKSAGPDKDGGEGIGPARQTRGPGEAQDPGNHRGRQPHGDRHVRGERGQASRERGDAAGDRQSAKKRIASCWGQLPDAAAGRTTAKYTSTSTAGPPFPAVRPSWNGSPGTTAVNARLRIVWCIRLTSDFLIACRGCISTPRRNLPNGKGPAVRPALSCSWLPARPPT
jgi:hypothetical protein